MVKFEDFLWIGFLADAAFFSEGGNHTFFGSPSPVNNVF
jgi:hypothetical protein